MTVPVTGTYQIFTQSSLDTFGFLYQSVFDIRFLYINWINYDDDSNGNSQFRLQQTFQAGQTYVVLVTTYDTNVTGTFTLVGTGAGIATFTRVTDLSEFHSSVAPCSIFSIDDTTLAFAGPLTFAAQYNVSSALTTSSPRFCRNSSCSNPTNYYQAISFNVSAAGSYIMATRGRVDTYGLLYNTTFNAANPMQGLIYEDDEGAGDGQFAVMGDLRPGVRYTVVVTTYDPNAVGAFVLTFFCSAAISIG